MAKAFKVSLFGAMIASLNGCGGGSGAPLSGPTAPTYETLSSTAASASTLKGQAVRFSTGNLTPDLVNVSGSLTHNTGAITVSDGTTSLTDPDGRDSAGRYSDGTNRLTTGDVQNTLNTDISQGYEYVTVFQLDGPNASSNTVGVYGVATNESDVPTSTTATYRGGSNVTVSNSNGATNFSVLSNGDSVVTADFASGTVDVELSNFRKTDLFGTVNEAPIDQVDVTGMQISGNTFSGGSTTTSLNGQQVNVVGTGSTEAASGSFFGYDAGISAPDEVGGVVVVKNDSSFVYGVYVAD
jgi:hypothetical protein